MKKKRLVYAGMSLIHVSCIQNACDAGTNAGANYGNCQVGPGVGGGDCDIGAATDTCIGYGAEAAGNLGCNDNGQVAGGVGGRNGGNQPDNNYTYCNEGTGAFWNP